jgi:preprotein translocase subunit Sec61beta
MASLYSPQSQAGVLSFYDAPAKGPKLNPKIVLIVVVVFALAVILLDHFIYV